MHPNVIKYNNPREAKRGHRILPQVHSALRPHHSEQVVDQKPLVLEQREGFQLMQLRLGSQEEQKVEEMVLQPLEPSGKKFGWVKNWKKRSFLYCSAG